MKAIIVSDIHDDLKLTSYLIEKVDREHYDNILIAGDIGYNSIIEFNKIASKIIAVKGNNDFSSFTNRASFLLPEVNYYVLNNKLFVLTHGDRLSFDDYMYYYGDKFDVFISGHTHVSKMEIVKDKIVLNPGSISYPRDGMKTYMIVDDNLIKLVDLNENIIKEINYLEAV